MRRSSVAWQAVLALVIAGCGATSVPTASQAADDPCAPDLPTRTSPTDYPVAVLYVNGDDLPPVVGTVEWLGGDEPSANEPRLPAHMERFTVLQTRGQAEVSVRMSDSVQIASWTVDVVPTGAFRAGDLESGRARWSEGADPTDIVCVAVHDGSWFVIADITFADDAGSGTYYWRLNVSETPGT